ncbi:MAG TPA: hypothetical protein PK760_11545, partial [Flavobacteriales bacterium]|nr:hypothetical protein [Flavobacteriales bacterium]
MSTIALQQRRDRNTGILVTIVFHALLLILFLFIGLSQWDPPLQEQVVEILMEGGGGEVGGGSSQPEASSTPASAPEENP